MTLTDLDLSDEQAAYHPVTGLPVLDPRQRRELDRQFYHWIDPATHHWPGCGSRHADCTCFYEAPDASEFATALRDGDRAIAAMVMDTSHADERPLILPAITSVEVDVVERVQIRPGLYFNRTARRIRALTGTPPTHIVGDSRPRGGGR